jgi:hypothetical protein
MPTQKIPMDTIEAYDYESINVSSSQLETDIHESNIHTPVPIRLLHDLAKTLEDDKQKKWNFDFKIDEQNNSLKFNLTIYGVSFSLVVSGALIAIFVKLRRDFIKKIGLIGQNHIEMKNMNDSLVAAPRNGPLISFDAVNNQLNLPQSATSEYSTPKTSLPSHKQEKNNKKPILGYNLRKSNRESLFEGCYKE